MPEHVEKVQVRLATTRAVASRLEVYDLDNDLPITTSELDAIERLLGADLHDLLNS